MDNKKRGGVGKTKPINLYICQSCTGFPKFGVTKMKEHLKTAHGLDLATTPWKLEILLHMDADEWYESQYQWTESKEGGVRFQQLVRKMRKDEDRYC